MTAIACLISFGCQAQQQTDEFTTKSGKKVRFTCIKHASIQINYNGLEIQVDPVGMGMKPETDYTQFPKADIILVTHEHHDHFDRDAIQQLSTKGTTIYVNPSVKAQLGKGHAMKNGDKVQLRIPALDNRELTATVYYIVARESYATWRATKEQGEFDSRTFEVRVRPDQAVEGLRPGMSALMINR